MKKVVIFGATGHTGKYLIRKMQQQEVELSVFVRTPAKLADVDTAGLNAICGDALDAVAVQRAMMDRMCSSARWRATC